MKKTIIKALLIGLAAAAQAQGFIFLDNINNGSTDPLATTSGLFWVSTGGTPVLINQDFNAAFYGGNDSSNLSLLATFLLSDGTARGDNGFGPGTFIDPTGKSYPIPGTTISAFFQIQAWTGNFNSYAGAIAAGAPAAQSPVFVNPAYDGTLPPPDLVNMPAMVLNIPEPSTFALAAFGGVCTLVLRRTINCRKLIVKTLILSLPLIGFAAGAHAQGFVFLDNINNTDPSPTATTGGLFFINSGAGIQLIQGDFNAAFYGGTDSANLQLIASFSGAAAVGTGGFGPGTWLDPTGKSYPIAGSTTSAFFMVQAWTGTATSYATATVKGQSPVFPNEVESPTLPPPDLVGMPAVCLNCIPEPSTFALMVLGVTGLCAFRLLKRNKSIQAPGAVL